MTSSFLSRGDTILRRQGRTARARRIADLSLQEKSLNIIIEEDESRSASSSRPPSPTSSSSSSSQNSALKARRRHADVSDIRIARGMIAHDSNDVLSLYDSPRAAPQPPLSSQPSLESFRLAFEDVAPQFPSPPQPFGFYEPASPTSSMSSSPRSRSGEMPLTPSTSDDEGSFVNPYHIEIQPLVITKHNQRFTEITGAELPAKDTISIPEVYDSDSESDSEWYTRELSNMITIRSPLTSSFPKHKISRPDSIISTPPASARRMSKALPSPPSPPVSSKRKSMRRSVIPNYPPPPPPVVETRPASISSTASLVDFPMHTAPPAPSRPAPLATHRPLPRSSIPADCVYDVDLEDSSSAFSFSIYEVDLGDERSASSGSAYSQPSFDAFAAQEITFDLDGGMMLPVSLPATPNDVDLDTEFNISDSEMEFVFSEDEQIQQLASSPSADDHSPSFPPSPSLSYYHSSASGSPPPPPPTAPHAHNVYMEEHNLKSKWSSSTLASVHQEHAARRGASSKLRLYFGGAGASAPKRGSAQSTSKKVPPTPTSPFAALMSPRKGSRAHTRGSSDTPVLGWGRPAGVRRRGSVATISDAGSEESASSTSSSGLRRKPIPIEMFLRS